MRTINIKTAGIFIILLFIYGCKETPEFSILTRLNLDGSCERTLIVENIDSDELLSENFPISVDSTWEMTFRADSVWIKDCDEPQKKADTTYFFHKTFESIEELNKEYSDTNNYYALLNRSIEFRKKFRWFYTYFEYTETFGRMYEGEPLNAFITEEEYMALSSESDSIPLFEGLDSAAIKDKKDSIDERFFQWLSGTFFNSYFNALYNQLKATDTLNHYLEGLYDLKDSLCNQYNMFELEYDDLYELIDSLLKAEGEILSLRDNKDSAMQDTYNKLELWGSMIASEPFNYSLLMPGELCTTNADSITGDTLQFVFQYDRFLTEDYKMKVKTRVVNKWSFYVSGAIVLLALIALLLGKKRNSKNNF